MSTETKINKLGSPLSNFLTSRGMAEPAFREVEEWIPTEDDVFRFYDVSDAQHESNALVLTTGGTTEWRLGYHMYLGDNGPSSHRPEDDDDVVCVLRTHKAGAENWYLWDVADIAAECSQEGYRRNDEGELEINVSGQWKVATSVREIVEWVSDWDCAWQDNGLVKSLRSGAKDALKWLAQESKGMTLEGM